MLPSNVTSKFFNPSVLSKTFDGIEISQNINLFPGLSNLDVYKDFFEVFYNSDAHQLGSINEAIIKLNFDSNLFKENLKIIVKNAIKNK